MLVLGLSPVSAQKHIYIVAAGIADYPGSDMDLSLCANDAKTIQWVFAKNKKASTILLTNSQATKGAILAALKKQFAKAGKKDAILFFFSGHGSPGNLISYDGPLDYHSIFPEKQASANIIFDCALLLAMMSLMAWYSSCPS